MTVVYEWIAIVGVPNRKKKKIQFLHNAALTELSQSWTPVVNNTVKTHIVILIMLWDYMRLQGGSSHYCYSVNDGSEIDVDSHVVLVLWGGPELLSVHVPISFHTPSFCLLHHIHKVPTQSVNEWRHWFWSPLWGLSAACFRANLQNPSPASQLVIKLWCEGTRIHRFNDESPPQTISEERTIISIPISIYLLLPSMPFLF